MVYQPGGKRERECGRTVHGSRQCRVTANGNGDGDERSRQHEVFGGDRDFEAAGDDQPDHGDIGPRWHTAIHCNRDWIGKHDRDLGHQPSGSWERERVGFIYRASKPSDATDGHRDGDQHRRYIKICFGDGYLEPTGYGKRDSGKHYVGSRSKPTIYRYGNGIGQYECDLDHQPEQHREHQFFRTVYRAGDCLEPTNRNGAGDERWGHNKISHRNGDLKAPGSNISNIGDAGPRRDTAVYIHSDGPCEFQCHMVDHARGNGKRERDGALYSPRHVDEPTDGYGKSDERRGHDQIGERDGYFESARDRDHVAHNGDVGAGRYAAVYGNGDRSGQHRSDVVD